MGKTHERAPILAERAGAVLSSALILLNHISQLECSGAALTHRMRPNILNGSRRRWNPGACPKVPSPIFIANGIRKSLGLSVNSTSGPQIGISGDGA